MSAGDILREAAHIVEGERGITHGPKERSFAAIAHAWNLYLATKGTITISPVDVAQMLALLKMMRALHGTPVRDHYLDQAAYAAIAGELAGAAGSEM